MADIKKQFIGIEQVRPFEKREPSSHTIAYYPLTSASTIQDKSGNNRNLTMDGTVTFGQYKGIDCAYFSGNTALYNSNFVSNRRTLTVMGFLYYVYHSSYGNKLIFRWGTNMGPYVNYFGNDALACSPGGTYTRTISSDTGWIHYAFTYDGNTTKKFYVNGELWGNDTGVNPPEGTGISISRTYQDRSGYTKGGQSEIIIEDYVWTQEEIVKYLNNMKSKYGIS